MITEQFSTAPLTKTRSVLILFVCLFFFFLFFFGGGGGGRVLKLRKPGKKVFCFRRLISNTYMHEQKRFVQDLPKTMPIQKRT